MARSKAEAPSAASRWRLASLLSPANAGSASSAVTASAAAPTRRAVMTASRSLLSPHEARPLA